MTAKVDMYTKRHCPHCDKAMELLKRKNCNVNRISIEFDESKVNEMIERVGKHCKTVPQIFIGSHHVGGCDDLYKLEDNNKLDEMIKNNFGSN